MTVLPFSTPGILQNAPYSYAANIANKQQRSARPSQSSARDHHQQVQPPQQRPSRTQTSSTTTTNSSSRTHVPSSVTSNPGVRSGGGAGGGGARMESERPRARATAIRQHISNARRWMSRVKNGNGNGTGSAGSRNDATVDARDCEIDGKMEERKRRRKRMSHLFMLMALRSNAGRRDSAAGAGAGAQDEKVGKRGAGRKGRVRNGRSVGTSGSAAGGRYDWNKFEVYMENSKFTPEVKNILRELPVHDRLMLMVQKMKATSDVVCTNEALLKSCIPIEILRKSKVSPTWDSLTGPITLSIPKEVLEIAAAAAASKTTTVTAATPSASTCDMHSHNRSHGNRQIAGHVTGNRPLPTIPGTCKDAPTSTTDTGEAKDDETKSPPATCSSSSPDAVQNIQCALCTYRGRMYDDHTHDANNKYFQDATVPKCASMANPVIDDDVEPVEDVKNGGSSNILSSTTTATTALKSEARTSSETRATDRELPDPPLSASSAALVATESNHRDTVNISASPIPTRSETTTEMETNAIRGAQATVVSGSIEHEPLTSNHQIPVSSSTVPETKNQTEADEIIKLRKEVESLQNSVRELCAVVRKSNPDEDAGNAKENGPGDGIVKAEVTVESIVNDMKITELPRDNDLMVETI